MKLTTLETEERPTNISTFQLVFFIWSRSISFYREDFKTKTEWNFIFEEGGIWEYDIGQNFRPYCINIIYREK